MRESIATYARAATRSENHATSAVATTYAQILKSSAIVGGATVATVVIGIARTKVMALLLGPSGVGLMGAYWALLDLARTMAELGINRSAVRQIAQASGSGDELQLSRSVLVLRRVAVVLGAVGAAVVLLNAESISLFTFGSAAYTSGVMLLSAAVFFGLIASGQSALLQGIRRIADLARVGIWGAVVGSIASVVIVYFLREDGIVPSIIAMAALGSLLSWWYARRVQLAKPQMSLAVMRTELSAMFRLGLAFFVSGLLMTGASYLVRMLVLQADGLAGAGLYQAGWTLGGMYVGFVLQAMGTDFYPRLVANVGDDKTCNRLVNEQAHVSILLAGPGVLATLVLSPWLISAFYSPSFEHAAEVLRLICVGMALRVVTWPMGFIIVAKNRQVAFIATELAWTAVNLGLSWFLIDRFGLSGAGMAFATSYVFHAIMIYPIVRRMTGFTWSRETSRAIAMFVGVVGAVFVLMLFPSNVGLGIGCAAVIASTVYSTRQILLLVDNRSMPPSVVRALSLFGLTPTVRRI